MPRIDERYEFTTDQEIAIGHIVVDQWGSNIQTGIDLATEVPFIYAQKGPNQPIKCWNVDRDGTVTVRS